jgi:ubiquinone/menaquinone biosynthesis C-methylase UbiE
LLAAGAAVTAVDFSAGMLEKARARLAGREATFLRHDLRERLPFMDEVFDAVLCTLALEHIESLEPVFREMRRVTKVGGFVALSDMHQAMRLRGKQASFEIEEGNKVLVEGYEHAVSEYVMGALRAGLRLESVSEHKPPPEMLAAVPRIASYVGWPMLVTLKLRRD